MFLTTVFALLSLLASTLTVMGIIKPSIFIKNKEMKGKRLKIGVSGTVLCLFSLILCSIFAPEQENKNQQQASTQTASQEQAPKACSDNKAEEENQNQQQASTQTANQEQAPKASSDNKAENAKPVVTIYDSAAKCIEETKNYSIEDGTLKVISPKEFVLTSKILQLNHPDMEKTLFRTGIVFILLHTFAHTKLDELTLHTKIEYIQLPYMKPRQHLTDLSLYKVTLHAKRKDVLAYLQKHYQINSFDELTDQSDSMNGLPVGELKGTLPSDKFEKIYYGSGKDGEQKAWDLIDTFKVNCKVN